MHHLYSDKRTSSQQMPNLAGLKFLGHLHAATRSVRPHAPVAEALWGITAAGNFEGRNHLRVVATVADVTDRLGIAPDEVRAAAVTVSRAGANPPRREELS